MIQTLIFYLLGLKEENMPHCGNPCYMQPEKTMKIHTIILSIHWFGKRRCLPLRVRRRCRDQIYPAVKKYPPPMTLPRVLSVVCIAQN